ncbi:MAG: hypothetical protein AB7E98_12015 [Pirellulales bacterium]
MTPARKPPAYAVPYQPGDVIVFAGRGLVSRTIALTTTTWGQFVRLQWVSHVGICAQVNRYGLLLFESTTLVELPCVIQGRLVRGVSAHCPIERVDSYQGKVWRLRLDPHVRFDAKRSGGLTRSLMSNLGKPYDARQAIMSGVPWVKRSSWTRPDRRAMFCDELVSTALIDAEIVPRGTYNPSAVAPGWVVWNLIDKGFYGPLERLR